MTPIGHREISTIFGRAGPWSVYQHLACDCFHWTLETAAPTFPYTKPRLLLLKLPMEGRIVGRSAAGTPNH
jgi:hypothetical protein